MEASDAEPVVIQAVLMSDYVVREAGTNKLTLAGIFSVLNCPGFPFATPPFWITVFLTNFRNGTKEANVVVRLEQKQTGMVLGNAAGRIQFAEGKIAPEVMVEIPFRMNSMFVPQPGNYRVVVLVNDDKVAERAFVVQAVSSPTILPPQP
jgi:hypothetical protein